ncbi:prolyl oligopeptidase-like protein [Amylocarpus encephaloides]|uniref:Carboxylic ester hydrolase n=1 Tax=Amylocarpus encephaloides TaxID=45428 RepID=A0A9P8C9X2_9HELO|nr:prolyl oligopeptidase-like protein [Amylocarpus encephaloides]
MLFKGASILLCASVAVAAPNKVRPHLPIVDLGYAVHQATINTTGNYYNFSNIRYAQPPVGTLRFSAPISPIGRNQTINNGQQNAICPQINPLWATSQTPFIVSYLLGGNTSQYTNSEPSFTPANLSSVPPPAPAVSEDCLFLDVVVPESIFNSKKGKGKEKGPWDVRCKPGRKCEEEGEGHESNGGAPVMVWIYGGGYTAGSKMGTENPAGLLARSREGGDEGVIYVAMNYRLGVFGWLAGNENVTANAGLLDQRLALEWVQENIHLFGGDPSRVTVFGESAGGGSIMHHITSYGGKGTVPFQQAIPQSPGFFLYLPSQNKELFAQVLGNASSIADRPIRTADELRGLSYDELYNLNKMMVGLATYGMFTFGPVVDDSPNAYVPDLPGRLISQGKLHNVPVLASQNSNEGLLFTPPFIQNQDIYKEFVGGAFPTANDSTISHIANELYPPLFNGSEPYSTQIQRTALTVADISFTCNAYWLRSYLTKSYGYLFSVPPGFHGQDIAYTYFNGDTSTLNAGASVNATVAMTLQRYLTTFAMKGIPEGIPSYKSNMTLANVGNTNLGGLVHDPAARSQCDFWIEAPYYVPNS